MRIQQLPETAEQFSSLETPTLGVHKHEERAAIRRQLRVLRGGGLNYVGIKGSTLEPPYPASDSKTAKAIASSS